MVTGSAAGLKKTCPSQFLADHLHGPSLTGYDRRRITCCELVTLRGTAYVAGCKVRGAVLGATRHRVLEGMVLSIRPHPPVHFRCSSDPYLLVGHVGALVDSGSGSRIAHIGLPQEGLMSVIAVPPTSVATLD